MKIEKLALYILCVIVGFISCKKDDDNAVIEVEQRDRTEQQIVDNDSIIGYLETHYYNAGAFQSNPDPSIADLIITKLPEDGVLPDPDNNKLLIEAVEEPKTVVFEETNYEFYILKLNQGTGPAPTFADNVRLTYEGMLLDDTVFDDAVTPIVFDLVTLIPAWRKVIPLFNTAESFVESDSGEVDFINHGAGVMFIPSGLAYFSGYIAGDQYAPLIFKFDLYQMEENDHDGDGVPSYLEDLNGDGEFTQEFDDTDGDLFEDFIDIDDDGDGVNTINEDIDGDGDPTNDIGKNGIPKYLDPEETESNQ